MEKWPMTDSQEVYRNDVAIIYGKKYKLPNNNEINVHILSPKSSSIVFPLTTNGELIMIRKYSPAQDDFFLELPAGLIEPNEDKVMVATRELKNKTGYESNKELINVGTLYPNPAHNTNDLYCYIALDVEKVAEPNPGNKGIIEVVKLDLGEVVHLAYEGKLQHMVTFSAFLLAYNYYLHNIKK